MISSALGYSGYMSTYQRNKMTSIALLSRGMINLMTYKYRVQQESTKYKPLLNPKNKQVIHDLAMAKGADDPNAADYTKFLFTPKAKAKYKVDPLTHGHLMNWKFVEDTVQREAVIIKIIPPIRLNNVYLYLII